MGERKFDDALKYLKKTHDALRQRVKVLRYPEYSTIGYIHWLKDDLDNAGQAFRTIVDPDNLGEQWQRSQDLAALCLSQGRAGQALEHAGRLRHLADKLMDVSLSRVKREAHYVLAYSYRLAGRLPEALKEAEEVCRDYKNPEVSAVLAVKLLHLRALITLEMNRLDEFEKQVEAIKTFSLQERFPKLMRAYYHLLGLRELRQNRGQSAIGYLEKALDLSTPGTRDDDPSVYLYSLAEAYELVKEPMRVSAITRYDEISTVAPRNSFCGDIYARSYYRKAKIYDDRWSHSQYEGVSKLRAIENYRKFLSLWGNADPIFSEVADARSRLAVLESK
jgi:tetratricopeptide (TPR) repeat protein